MINRIGVAGIALAIVLTAAGCSDASGSDPPTPTPEPLPHRPPSSAPRPRPPRRAAALPTESTVDLAECMSGRYLLARFLGLGGDSVVRHRKGGDVTIDIDGATGDDRGRQGTDRSDAGRRQGHLTVDGTVEGTCRPTTTAGSSA